MSYCNPLTKSYFKPKDYFFFKREGIDSFKVELAKEKEKWLCKEEKIKNIRKSIQRTASTPNHRQFRE